MQTDTIPHNWLPLNPQKKKKKKTLKHAILAIFFITTKIIIYPGNLHVVIASQLYRAPLYLFLAHTAAHRQS